jgi:hypothetical protein
VVQSSSRRTTSGLSRSSLSARGAWRSLRSWRRGGSRNVVGKTTTAAGKHEPVGVHFQSEGRWFESPPRPIREVPAQGPANDAGQALRVNTGSTKRPRLSRVRAFASIRAVSVANVGAAETACERGCERFGPLFPRGGRLIHALWVHNSVRAQQAAVSQTGAGNPSQGAPAASTSVLTIRGNRTGSGSFDRRLQVFHGWLLDLGPEHGPQSHRRLELNARRLAPPCSGLQPTLRD